LALDELNLDNDLFKSHLFRKFDTSLSDSTSSLLSKLWLANTFNGSFYTDASLILDDIEDKINSKVAIAWKEQRRLRHHELVACKQILNEGIVKLLKKAKEIKVS
jgi:hypothetical protein